MLALEPPCPSTLELAAKAGMIVKLHVNDGCDHETEIPVKNLLQVNTKKEILTNKASYAILRHCALTQLFKYEPNGKIPNYALKNFRTQFTYYQVSKEDPSTPLKKFYIKNADELTRVLEAASMNQLVDDNDNIILEIHCDFINEFTFDEGAKLRREATAAADNVVRTLRQWMKKASTFVSNHAHKLTPHDFVVVSEDLDQNKNNKDHDHSPIEWAARFIEVLLLPEATNDLHSWTTVPKNFDRSTSTSTTKRVSSDELIDQYEDTLENIATSVVKGLECASKFFLDAIKECEKQMNQNQQKNMNSDVLSISSGPSLAESSCISSASSSSSSVKSSTDDVVVEQGVEIIFDKKGNNNEKSEEWKVFFGEGVGKEGDDNVAVDDDAVLINHICNSEIVSVSSSVKEDDMSSFEELSDKDSESDNASWAMLSDEE